MRDSRSEGRKWETFAEAFLRRRGLKPIGRNYRQRFGEIDLLLLDRHTLVFAEVRFRASDDHGSGADSVTPAKQKRIIAAAAHFLQLNSKYRFRPCRFDVISIGTEGGQPTVDWIKGAFES